MTQVVTTVAARPLWNHTGIQVVEGRSYAFRVPPDATWKDWTIACGPEGHHHWTTEPWRWLLRVRHSKGQSVPFFALIGTLGESLDHAFMIGAGCAWVAPASGELVCFANDVSWAYWNNSGAISLDVSWQ